MQFRPVAQNLLEWIALKAGLVPLPLAYSHFGFLMSKVVLEATDKGIFEIIGSRRISLVQIAEECKLNGRALNSLLRVLTSMGLVKNTNNLFSLTTQSKKWLLKGSASSIYWLMMFDNRVCFKWMDHVGTFLESGHALQYHESFNSEEWFYYQKAMFATATLTAKEIVKKIIVPQRATRMLDIGGANGVYSAEICKKHLGLHSTIIDLEGAIEQSAPALKQLDMSSAITSVAADILYYDIGKNQYDLTIMASLAHHFTYEQNLLVAKKVYQALKPGGYFFIIDLLRPHTTKLNNDLLSSMGDFFYALSSTSGAWSLPEIRRWLEESGFKYIKKSIFLSIPGYAAVMVQKSSN